MQPRKETKAIIVGAGIGGLAAAIALRKVGVEATVFERASHLGKIQVGGSYVLWYTGTGSLRELGVLQKLLPLAGPVDFFEFRTWQGAELVKVPVGERSRVLEAPVMGVMRADLHRALYEELGDGVVQTSAPCMGFQQDDEGVTVHFADGREERGDVLIGADGINSVILRQLHGDVDIRYPGYGHWYGIIDYDHPLAPRGTFRILYGEGRRFAFFRIPPNRLSWWCTFKAPPAKEDPDTRRKERLLECFKGWEAPAQEVIEFTPDDQIIRRDTMERRPLKRWGEGRVTLLGDAAHLATFNLGQGAGSAIKDAVMLARYFETESDPVTALRRYEARRIPATTTMVNRSWTLGAMAAWENPLAAGAHEWFLKIFRNLVGKSLETDVDFEL